jgi:hypothetical protein
MKLLKSCASMHYITGILQSCLDLYSHMFISTCVILGLRHPGQGLCPKILHKHARCDRSGLGGAKVKVQTLMATDDRWTRQLMLNRLYSIIKHYFGLYTHLPDLTVAGKGAPKPSGETGGSNGAYLVSFLYLFNKYTY